MKRILMMVLRNILMVPFGWIRLCYRAAHVDKYTEEDMYEFLKWIDLRANRGGNVYIDAHGVEKRLVVGIKAAGPAKALLIEFLVFLIFEFDGHFVPPSGSFVQGNHRLGKTMTPISALMFASLAWAGWGCKSAFRRH